MKATVMAKFVQLIAILCVLLALSSLFLYSPFYSRIVVNALNYWVPVEVNEVAAKSQKRAALSTQDDLEPGSMLWIARRTYFELLNELSGSQPIEKLALIQARYKVLQKMILEEQEDQKNKDQEEKPEIPELIDIHAIDRPLDESPEASALDASSVAERVFDEDSMENKAMVQKYKEFLNTYPITVSDQDKSELELEVLKDLENIKQTAQDTVEREIFSKPYAIVVLGGGLTLDENGKEIVVNPYTRLRLEKTLELEKKYKLPIVLSGVEAPYMQAWLKARDVEANLLENRSMNTCENTRFSSLLLQKKGGAPTVILVTDVYHMPRTRRLFALNGIETIPVEAPMPTQLTRWRPSEQNYDHSRRANYEMLATIRDILFGSSDCREVP